MLHLIDRRRRPVVSVIMPVYNGERFVAAAVESILGQTWEDFELVVVNDGSTDGTSAVLTSFTDPRMRVLQGRHLGEGAARNQGLDEARGQWVVWQDSDDVSTPVRLSMLLDAVSAGAKFAHSDMVNIDEQSRPVGYYRATAIPRSRILPFILRRGTPFNNPSMMLDRASIGTLRFDESLTLGVDTDFVRRFAPFHEGTYVPEPLLLYRSHEDQATLKVSETTSFPEIDRLLTQEDLAHLVPTAFQEYDPDAAIAIATSSVALHLSRRSFPRAATEWFSRAADASPDSDTDTGRVVAAAYLLATGDPRAVLNQLIGVRATSTSEVLRAEATALLGDLQQAGHLYGCALALAPQNVDAVAGLRAVSEVQYSLVVDDPAQRILGVDPR